MVIGLGVLVGGVVVVVAGGVVVLVGGVVVVVAGGVVVLVGGVVVVDVEHTGFVIVFESRVTAPLRANSRPSIVALVLAAIDVSARIVP
jgi:hypothetical protein